MNIIPPRPPNPKSMENKKHHFLVVTYPAQGHINPALHLAHRLARLTASPVTFSTTVSAHRRMFANSTTPTDQQLTYIPFSDGHDDGLISASPNLHHIVSQIKTVGSRTLSALLDDLAAAGRPVTCVIYSVLLFWAADVARHHRIPSALYWIQPATVFAVYYHWFHGYETLTDDTSTVKLPGLPSLRVRELPSFLTDSDDESSKTRNSVREVFETQDREIEHSRSSKLRVLVNTFDELEPDALKSVDQIDLIAVGPTVPPPSGCDLFTADGEGWAEWLDSKAEKSVVYVSFGTMSVVEEEQMAEIARGLGESERPYLWAVRKESRSEGLDLDLGEKGMVVEWCSQVGVLSHRSVGCFVSHCGWNSTAESLVCGVPMVGVGRWSDQRTNGRLVEGEWGTGVRAEMNGDGVVEGEELKRCLDLVMGEAERGAEIRKKAEFWREKAREALGECGSSDRNLRAFVEGITKWD